MERKVWGGWGIALALSLFSVACQPSRGNRQGLTSPSAALIAVEPSPAPKLPSEMDPEPVLPIYPLSSSAQAPQIAEFTRSAQGGESWVAAGQNLDRAGLQFRVFQPGAAGGKGIAVSPLAQAQQGATLVLPDSLVPGMAVIWPSVGNEVGAPAWVNRTEAWWVGPDQLAPGETSAVFGRNLENLKLRGRAWLYVVSKPSRNGTWVTPKAVNPYRLEFTLPPDLPAGSAEVWVHNGHGGKFGWSGPLEIQITDKSAWADQEKRVLNVRDFGAQGDGLADDSDAINRAIRAAGESAPATVFLPRGRYRVLRALEMRNRVRVQGEDVSSTSIELGADLKAALSSGEGRGYTIFFNDWSGLQGFQLAKLTLKIGEGGKPADMPLLRTRGAQDLRLEDVAIEGQQYGNLDLHGARRVFITRCKLVGSGAFLGTAEQVFFDQSEFRLTHLANSAVTSWGGQRLSFTRSLVRDHDPARSDGMGEGRFFVAQGHWGPVRNIYFGENETQDLAPPPAAPDQNVGEQILFEMATSPWVGSSRGPATLDTVQLPALAADFPAVGQGIAIVSGKGLGQHRKIAAFDPGSRTVTVSPPWRVPPEASSVVSIGATSSQVAVYRNRLDGKADWDTRVMASAGVQLYGQGYDFVVDQNSFHELRTAISVWSLSYRGYRAVLPSYFNLFTGNTAESVVSLILQFSSVEGSSENYAGQVGLLGNLYRSNHGAHITEAGAAFRAGGTAAGNDQVLTVLENNQWSDLAQAISAPAPSDPAGSRIVQTVLSQNVWDRGTLGASGTPAITPPRSIDSWIHRFNTVRGF